MTKTIYKFFKIPHDQNISESEPPPPHYFELTRPKYMHCKKCATRTFRSSKMNYLAERLGNRDGAGKEAVVLESAVESGPVVVLPGRVHQVPRDQPVLLSLARIALLAARAAANAPESAVRALTDPRVVVLVDPDFFCK